MNPKLKIVIAMTAFGTISIFVKNIPLPSGEIALYRAIIAAVAIYFYKLIVDKRICFPSIKKDLPLLFISGALIGFNWILLFEAYHYTTVSLATLSYYFAPVIIIIVCPFIFRERISMRQFLCFMMATIGMVLIIGAGGMDQSKNNMIGIILGLSAAVMYAAVVIINKFIKRVSGIDRTVIQFSAAIIVLIPYVALTTGINLSELNYTGTVSLIILGLIHTGLCYVLYFSSLKDLKGQEAAIISYIDPMTAIAVSIFILGEPISLQQITGGIMILGFTLLNEVGHKSMREGI